MTRPRMHIMYITTNVSLICLTLAGVIIVDKTENSLSTSQATMTVSVMNAKVGTYFGTL
jgi:hypothetical protein